MAKKVLVIGGGLGGLSASCVLAARGYDTTVIEANSWIGGKAAQLDLEGFRFDMGPTILTVPSVLERVFAESGRRLEDYLNLIRLDPQWRSFFSDGSTLDLVADTNRSSELIGALTGRAQDMSGYREFMRWSRRLSEVSQRFFFYRSVGGLQDMFDWKEAVDPGLWNDLRALRMGQSVYKSIRRHIKDPRVAQMVDHFTQYVGSCPEQSPAVLCGIADMQTDEGVWYPMGGTRAVPVALERLARELGVAFELGSEVRRLVVSDEVVRGVQLEDGRTLESDFVVSNRDVVRSMVGFGAPDSVEGRFANRRQYEPACSGVVLYLGLNRRYEHIAHHNFVFSDDAHEEFESIYAAGEPAKDPTLYVCAPAGTESAVAPEGGEAMYILAHTPYLRDNHDWGSMGPEYRNRIIEKLKSVAGLQDIEDRIVVESMLTPQDIHDRYRVYKGAIYGLASHGTMTGAFKPSNRSPDLEGLYFAGGSAHPGPGMPMALMSGWIAANALDSDEKNISETESPFGASFSSRFQGAGAAA